MSNQKRSRAWAFTLNNYTPEEVHSLIENSGDSYLVFGFEVGKQGTYHLQGYIHHINARTFSSMSKLLPRAHLEVARSSPDTNIKYCTKDGDYHEFGLRPKGQGTRTDLDDIKDMLDSNMSIHEVAQTHFSQVIRYNKGFQFYLNGNQKDRSDKPTVYFVHGPTGTGKTRFAFQISDSVYIKDGTQWWDGYKQQSVILIDDFDGKWPFRDLLRILDRYPYQGQVKGGYVKINSPIIIITCDRTLERLYDGSCTELELAQLRRRITHFIEKT